MCPVRNCATEVPVAMLMCARHWYMVPRALRMAVWTAWRGGAGADTAQHEAAKRAAIRSVNEQLERAR